MTARPKKHTHRWRIVSHSITLPPVAVLLMCADCTLTETRHLHLTKVKVADRKYRPATMDEFREGLRGIPHICCKKVA